MGSVMCEEKMDTYPVEFDDTIYDEIEVLTLNIQKLEQENTRLKLELKHYADLLSVKEKYTIDMERHRANLQNKLAGLESILVVKVMQKIKRIFEKGK